MQGAESGLILYLSRAEVKKTGLTMPEIIEEVEQALIEKSMGRVEMPPKPGIHPRRDAFIHAMPAYVAAKGAAGIKWVSGYPENLKAGLPYIMGLIILNDPETGMPLSVMDASWITAMRTAAATVIAARHMAPGNPETAGILGCGVQARSHVEALSIVYPSLRLIKAHDIDEERQKRFVEEIGVRFPKLRCLPSPSSYEAIRDADIVISVIPIQEYPSPIIQAEWLKEGCFGAAVAFDSGWSVSALSCFDRIVTDDIDQLDYYRSLGFFKGMPRVDTELEELLLGKAAGRQSEKERTLSVNLGLAIEDVIVAWAIYEKAKHKGLGRWLPLFG